MLKPSIMKKLLLALFPLYSFSQVTHVEEIITGNVFCVHSRLYVDTTLFNTSNIYILKGTSDSVWIFGMGYGKPEDLRVYRDCVTLQTSFDQDMHQVDSVINLFGFTSPKIMFIVPHFHLDHANAEFVYGMDSIYGTMQSKIYVHIRDQTQCTCNSHCCGYPTGCTVGTTFFGAPYDRTWGQPLLAQFKKIGFKTDQCNNVLKTITTSYANWHVVKGTSTHTPGGMDMRCPSKNLRLVGADAGLCPSSPGLISLPIHGDCGLAAPISP